MDMDVFPILRKKSKLNCLLHFRTTGMTIRIPIYRTSVDQKKLQRLTSITRQNKWKNYKDSLLSHFRTTEGTTDIHLCKGSAPSHFQTTEKNVEIRLYHFSVQQEGL